jgi:hypothetical protein
VGKASEGGCALVVVTAMDLALVDTTIHAILLPAMWAFTEHRDGGGPDIMAGASMDRVAFGAFDPWMKLTERGFAGVQ